MVDRESDESELLDSAPTVHWPAWLISLCFHAALIVLAAFFVQLAPRGGVGDEQLRDAGIVLKSRAANDQTYYADADDVQASESSTAAAALGDSASALPASDAPPVDLSQALPSASPLPGAGAVSSGLPGQGDLTGRAGQPGGVTGGEGTTSVFGISGTGYKFLYVFDHSASMGGSGNSALAYAKRELLASLESLGETHQFQIIFYNESPTIFPLAGAAGRLIFGTEQNRELARRFVQSITANGATRHEEALVAALRMRPDVIFFLTDGDEPAMSAGQLDRIRKLNGGLTSLNAIEFGLGPKAGRENFLAVLARQNGGTYKYLDITGQTSE